MELAFLRFFESLPAALAVGLLLLPRLIDEDGARFKLAIALFASLRAVLGFFLIAAIAREIIPAERPVDYETLVTFCTSTVVGKAWVATQLIALAFAALTIARLVVKSDLLDKTALGAGGLVLAVTSVTGHAIDDSFTLFTQASFLLHTLAGLIWIGGLLGLVWWMLTGRGKSPEVAARLAERWSLIAKIAIVVVIASGLAIAWENVGSFANLLATPYGRWLTVKLALFCAAMLAALALALYINRQPATDFDLNWYGRVGAGEAVAAVGLLFIAGYISVSTPASHETDLYWPLPFRLSWAATWGYIGMKLPWIDVPNWYLAPAWSGVAALVFAALAVAAWLAPRARPWRRMATPVMAALAALGVASSFTTLAYTDTFNDPAVDYTAESVTRGQKVFEENCVACHGDSGNGNGEMAKGLKVPPADLTAPHVGNHTIGDIFHWISYGGTSGVMPGFKDSLDTDDRWDVINYLLMLSYTIRARDTLRPQPPIMQWLIAPDFQLIDPENKVTTFFGLRGASTLVSFARCNASGVDEKALESSLELAHETAKSVGANHVTVYQGGCPDKLLARVPSHPKAVEAAFSVINRYPNETPSSEISEAHFLIDPSGFLRARYRHFSVDDGSAGLMRNQVSVLAKEPFVVISLHSH
jgi:putative copper resistance protein D